MDQAAGSLERRAVALFVVRRYHGSSTLLLESSPEPSNKQNNTMHMHDVVMRYVHARASDGYIVLERAPSI